MGLMDILNGMQNGPRGETEPGKGGMSPMTMAILAMLAYKAFKHVSGSGSAPQIPSGGNAPSLPSSTTQADGGGLGGLLKGGLGGLLAGGAAGSILSGGLGDLIKQFQEKGQGDVANSWVGKGPNKPIDTNDLASALGADQLNALMQHTGLGREELLQDLSTHLPDAVNDATPEGRLPTEHEASRWV